MRVCVVGAGRAGTEAAREAARCGADVTIVDALESALPEWEAWPDLITGHVASPSAVHRLPEVNYLFGARVASVAQDSARLADGRRLGADAVVAAVGSGFELPLLEGRSKGGVALMDSPAKYEWLGRQAKSSDRVVVAGEGPRALAIAERVAGAGRRVTVLLSSWRHGAPGPQAEMVLRDAAHRIGVSFRMGPVGRALGARRLEAVLSDGDVVPCDLLAVSPRRVPAQIHCAASIGSHGGILVGLGMGASVHGLYSAGGCAELSEGNPPHFTLEDERGPSGRVAGANGAGFKVLMPAARRATCSMFGLIWTRVGAGFATARSAGFGVGVIGERHGERSSCKIVYDRSTGTVLGIEVVADGGCGGLEVPPLGPQVDLRALAYDGGFGSSDISMVSETARLGLKEWSRYSSATTSK